MPKNSLRTDAIKLVFWQFLFVLGLALILLIVQGEQSAISAVLGGAAYCLPNLLFVWRVFARTTPRAAKQFLIAFVLGETTKLFLSAILFVLIVKYLPIKLLAVLGGYITAIMAFWIVSFIFMSREGGEAK